MCNVVYDSFPLSKMFLFISLVGVCIYENVNQCIRPYSLVNFLTAVSDIIEKYNAVIAKATKIQSVHFVSQMSWYGFFL